MTTNPLVVLFISNHGEIVGGGEVSLLTLLAALDQSRWAPSVVVPHEGPMADRCRALGLPTHVIPMPGLRLPGPRLLQSVMALKQLTRKTGAVLLHANGSRAMLYAGLAGRWAGRPVIWHLRVWRPDARLDWLLARLATRTIAISEAVRKRLLPWPFAYERCTVVPNGIDLTQFAATRSPDEVRVSLGLRPPDRAIGVVGRLVEFKGQEYVLDALARLRPVFPQARLLVVGDGPRRAFLEQRARDLNVTDKVRFTGHREDIADLLGAMEIFVLPSMAEDFGRVLLEAMAMERPVVATAAGGAPEVVDENVTGLLVPPADPNALAEAISALLVDPARARVMGEAGRRRVEGYFTVERHAALVEAVYAQVVQERE